MLQLMPIAHLWTPLLNDSSQKWCSTHKLILDHLSVKSHMTQVSQKLSPAIKKFQPHQRLLWHLLWPSDSPVWRHQNQQNRAHIAMPRAHWPSPTPMLLVSYSEFHLLLKPTLTQSKINTFSAEKLAWWLLLNFLNWSRPHQNMKNLSWWLNISLLKSLHARHLPVSQSLTTLPKVTFFLD